MSKLTSTAAALLLSCAFTPAAFAADVGASVTIGQPGFYGTINIGDAPRPRLIYPEPVFVEVIETHRHQPLYLNVPPGHAKKWKKHCHKYNACGYPVYFVQNDWYETVYVSAYQQKHSKHDGHHGKSHGKHKDKGHKNK